MVIMLWKKQIQTDRFISNNKPDIIFRDSERGDVYVDRYLQFQEAEM